MHIAVAEGTGLIGRMVVDAVRAGGDTPIVLARSTGVDLMTGDGLTEALVNADVIIDVTNLDTGRPVDSVCAGRPAFTTLNSYRGRTRTPLRIGSARTGIDDFELCATMDWYRFAAWGQLGQPETKLTVGGLAAGAERAVPPVRESPGNTLCPT